MAVASLPLGLKSTHALTSQRAVDRDREEIICSTSWCCSFMVRLGCNSVE